MMNEDYGGVDHFKIWDVRQEQFGKQVSLLGQFDETVQERNLEFVFRLGNPVSKNQEPIRDPETHLVGYTLQKIPGWKEKRRWVDLSNQFGQEHWLLGPPQLLFVPAGKSLMDEPPPEQPQSLLDHFLCYLVEKESRISRAHPLTLFDQFDERMDRREEIEEITPEFFGVPVSKNGESIHNERTHLAIYRIDPYETLEAPLKIRTNDQFGRRGLVVTGSHYLAVPSEKLNWGEQEKEGQNQE